MTRDSTGQSVGTTLSYYDGIAYDGLAATVTVNVKIDGGAQAPGAGTVTKDAEGDGTYSYAPTQAETDGKSLLFTFSAPGCSSVPEQVYTEEGSAYGVLADASTGLVPLHAKVDTVDDTTIATNVVVEAMSSWTDGILECQAHTSGHTTSQITIGSGSHVDDAAASATDDVYNGMMCMITSDTLKGQTREVVDYVGATRVLTLESARPFIGTPGSQIRFLLMPQVSYRAFLTNVQSLLDDARTEPAQGAPPVNPDMATKVDWLYKLAINKSTQTAAGAFSVYNFAGSTVDHKGTVSDDGTTYTKPLLISGP